MESQLFQNIDNPQSNPLAPEKEIQAPAEKINTKDPKIMVLAILGVILIVLLIAGVVVTLMRKTTTKPIQLPDNQPANNNTPTPIVDILPDNYRLVIENIQNNIKSNEEYLPPVIDVNIGL